MLTPEQKQVRDERLTEAIRHGTARFIQRESNGKSLITITRILLSDDKKKARILFTTLPDSYEEQALLFLNRSIHDLVLYLKKDTKFSRLPLLSFAVDHGERNRQRIDIISSKEN